MPKTIILVQPAGSRIAGTLQLFPTRQAARNRDAECRDEESNVSIVSNISIYYDQVIIKYFVKSARNEVILTFQKKL